MAEKIVAKDLRIGNLVLLNGEVREVKGLPELGLIFVDATTEPNPYLATDEQIEPINLSDEWVLKYGFKHTKMGWVRHLHKDNSIGLIKFKKFWSVGISGAFGLVHPKQIHFVHQLQNLYHALTGQELTT